VVRGATKELSTALQPLRKLLLREVPLEVAGQPINDVKGELVHKAYGFVVVGSPSQRSGEGVNREPAVKPGHLILTFVGRR